MSMLRHRLRHDEAGLTLVELLVTMVIFGIVGGMITAWVISSQRVISDTDVRFQSVTQVREAAVEASRVLRTARRLSDNSDAFVDASPTQVTFHANFKVPSGEGPKLIRMTLEGDELVEYIQSSKAGSSAPIWDYDPVENGRKRVLATGVQNTDIFTYLDQDGDPTDPMVASANDPGRITLRLDVQLRDRVDPVSVTQEVRLPNFLLF